MEYTSLPDSYVDGRRVPNRILADNGWPDVTTSVHTGRGEKYVLGRKTEGIRSFNIWTAEPLDDADLAALDAFRSSPFALSSDKEDKKKLAKQQRDSAMETAIFAACEYPEDWETLSSARANIMAEYAYINGKGLSQSHGARKSQLESLLEWTQVISAELRSLNESIDAATDKASLDAIEIIFTPAP